MLEASGWASTIEQLGLTRGVISCIIARVPVRRASLIVAELRAPKVAGQGGSAGHEHQETDGKVAV